MAGRSEFRAPSGAASTFSPAAALLVVVLTTAGCTTSPEPPVSSTSTLTADSSSSATETPTPMTSTVDGPVDPTPAGTETAGPPQPTPSDGIADPAPFTADTALNTGDPSGTQVGTVVDLRVGAHDGFDRVVIEVDGPDTPGWQVGYVDEAIGDPSGVAVDIDGDEVLQVLLHTVAYPEDGTSPYDGPSSIRVKDTGAVAETVLSSIFEGELQAFIGVDGGTHPFRVYPMSDPARIVIEVQS